MILFISGGEIFIILLFILIFFGADKIPEFMRIMGKGVREFRKATDDIKREFQENSSGIVDEVKSISNDISNRLTKEIDEPIRETVNETAKTFDEYQEQYNVDYYYNNRENISAYGSEYQNEAKKNSEEPVSEEPVSEKTEPQNNSEILTEPKSETA
jgi:sec-independent protein translocase protein TatA